MVNQVRLPELGESVIEARIGRWLKDEGDFVAVDDLLVEVETDKVTTAIVAEFSGTLLKITVSEGEIADVGTILAIIGASDDVVETNGHTTKPSPILSAKQKTGTVDTQLSQDIPTQIKDDTPTQTNKANPTLRISPLAKRIAKEHQLDISQIVGTGLYGRITKRDVKAQLSQSQTTPALSKPTATVSTESMPHHHSVKPPLPPSDDDTRTPLTTMRRLIAERMVYSKHTIPHATTIFEVDFSAVLAHRREQKAKFAQRGVHLTVTPYIVAVTASALHEHPIINSQWADDNILLKQEVNIGLATAIPQGLIVPVIKQADTLNLTGLAQRVNDLANRARLNQLKSDEVQGGTFTITNHGVSGSLVATPIINHPQCGILGVGNIEKRVVVISNSNTDMIAIRPRAYVSFTFDHRILDGATADAFVRHIKNGLETWGKS